MTSICPHCHTPVDADGYDRRGRRHGDEHHPDPLVDVRHRGPVTAGDVTYTIVWDYDTTPPGDAQYGVAADAYRPGQRHVLSGS